MFIKYTFDIQSHQPVYAVCTTDHQCVLITTDILIAIQKVKGA